LVKSVLDKTPNYHFDPKQVTGSILHLTLVIPADIKENPTILLAASLEEEKNAPNSLKAFADISVNAGQINGRDVSESVAKVLKNLYELKRGGGPSSKDHLNVLLLSVEGQEVGTSALINAINALAERKEQKAIPHLINLLKRTDNFAVANSCLIALGDLGAEAAMDGIIEFAERKPSIIRLQAIVAARKIASKSAAEWLFVMAYGHEDPRVRKEAMDALLEVEKKLGLKTEEEQESEHI
jgi:hypothetical protein